MKKIMIVDDHADIRRLIKITLGINFEVLEAGNGADCLKIAKEKIPDLFVLDVMMPGGIDGLEVLDKIRADEELKNARVIMVTARGQAQDYSEGIKRGADEYFIKPFSPLQLLAAIKKLTS